MPTITGSGALGSSSAVLAGASTFPTTTHVTPSPGGRVVMAGGLSVGVGQPPGDQPVVSFSGMTPSAAWTFALWFYPYAASSGEDFLIVSLTLDSSSSSVSAQGLDPGYVNLLLATFGPNTLDSVPCVAERWHLLVVTTDGAGDMTAFLDGVNIDAYWVGGIRTGGVIEGPFSGTTGRVEGVAGLAYWDQAFSVQEVQALYAASISDDGALASGAATMAGVGALSGPITGDGALVSGDATVASVGVVEHTGGGTLVADPSSMVGVGGPAPRIFGTAETPVELGGTWSVTQVGDITVPVDVVGSFPLVAAFNSLLVVPMEVVGTLLATQSDQATLEADYEKTGRRSTFTLTVYHLTVTRVQDTLVVPFDRSFLVSAAYTGGPGDALYEAGAFPNAIGTRIKVNSSTSYLVFRRPIDFEVVWFVDEERLLRWEPNRESGAFAWKPYKSASERSLDNQYVYSIFDPDGVYSYYARILGVMDWKLTYDSNVLLDQIDPRRCSRWYLPLLAVQWGLDLDFNETDEAKRKLTANAVPAFKFKGLDLAVRIKLASLGYSGYANEIWANPTNVANAAYKPLTPLNKAGESSSGPDPLSGAGVDTVEYPHSYHNEYIADYYLTSRLSIHLNNQDGSPVDLTPAIKNRVYSALRFDVLPAHVDIRTFVTDHNVLGAFGVGEGIVVADALTVLDV